MANTPPPADPPADLMPIGGFITTASDAIPAAGLLTAKPELLSAQLTAADWQAELTAYLNSPRP